MTGPERVRAELLDILGLDASAHIVDFYGPMLDALGVTRSTEILDARSRSEILIAGVKVATQTPPVRSGRRVVFLTLDDATGPVDATFFEDAQGPYATTVFHSWMLLVRGITRRTGPRGVSVRATGAWELSGLWEAWTRGGLEAVLAALEAEDREMVAPQRRRPGRRRGRPTGVTCRSPRRSAPAAVAANAAVTRRIWTPTPVCRAATGTTPTTPRGSTGLPRWLRWPPGRSPPRGASRGHGRSPHAAAGRPPTGAGPRIGVQAVALRRRQAGRRGHPRRPRARDVADRPRRVGAIPGTIPGTVPGTDRSGRPRGRLGPRRSGGQQRRVSTLGMPPRKALARQPRKLGALG